MKAFIIWMFTIGYVAAISNELNIQWDNYKVRYARVYDSKNDEIVAKNNFINNKIFVDNHNNKYNQGYYTYSVAINEFSDKSLSTFSKYFDEAELNKSLIKPSVVITQNALNSFDYANLNFESKLNGSPELGCSSGWAFSVASVLEIFYQYITDPSIKTGPLSPQQLIDCSGKTLACTKQVPHNGFNYLTLGPSLSTAASYPYKNKIGLCIIPAPIPNTVPVTIDDYASIQDGDKEQLKKVISYWSPVSFDFNPKSLQFMHYSQGIFVQPSGILRGSHFMTITGFGADKSQQYWKVKNSFGEDWGENGYIRISGSTLSIPKSAVHPIKN